jgi:AraC-like DNA-binding protein
MGNEINDLIIKFERIKHTRFIRTEWKNLKNVIDPFSRLYYVKSGSADIIISGKRRHFQAGNVYLIPSKISLYFISPSEEFNHYWIHFKTCLPGNLCIFDFYNCPLSLPAKSIKNAEFFFERLDQLKDKLSDAGGLLEAKGIMHFLLFPFIENASNTKSAQEKFLEFRKFKKVLDYMENNIYSKDISLEKLGKIASMHPTYFCNSFKKMFEVSPRRYICRMRIMKAQELLINTQYPIKDIAYRTGYSDACFFSRIFKKYVGVTPKIYRSISMEN